MYQMTHDQAIAIERALIFAADNKEEAWVDASIALGIMAEIKWVEEGTDGSA